MAIIKTTLNADGATYPSYCTLQETFLLDDDTLEFVTIGSGGGTEMTKEELMAYAKELHTRYPMGTWSVNTNPPSSTFVPSNSSFTAYSNSEIETLVNDWCTAKGI